MINILFFGVRNIISCVILIIKVVVQFVDSFGIKEDIKKVEVWYREYFFFFKSFVEFKKRLFMDIFVFDCVKVYKFYVGVIVIVGFVGFFVYNNG